MGFRNPVYSLRLQPSCFTYGTVGISKSGLKLCEFFLESKNFHLEPDRIFFHMTCLFFVTYSVLLSVCFRLVTLFVFVSVLSTCFLNPLSTKLTKWSNTLKTIGRQFADELFECVWPFCGIDA